MVTYKQNWNTVYYEWYAPQEEINKYRNQGFNVSWGGMTWEAIPFEQRSLEDRQATIKAGTQGTSGIAQWTPEYVNAEFQSKPLAERQAIIAWGTAPTNTTTWPTSVSGVLWEMWVSEYDAFAKQLADEQSAIYNTPIDEEQIKKDTLAQFQSQIDAINSTYADQLRKEQLVWEWRLGSTRAIQARSGLLGSSFWEAQKSWVQALNLEQEKAIENERLATVSQVLSQARTNAAQEIKDKRAAREAGWQAYLQYLSDSQTRKAQSTQEAAKRLVLLGKTPQDITDQELQGAGISRSELNFAYQDLKAQKDTADAQAQAAAEKQALEAQKTQAEIDKINADIAKWQLDSTKYYEVWNRIYARNEDGTSREIWTAVFNPYTGTMQVTPWNQVYNPVTGQFTQAPTQGGWQVVYQWDPNTRAGRHNNPTAFTTDVAKTAWLVEWVDYTKWDAFTWWDWRTYYTANILGNAVDQTIKAIDNYVARWAFPWWTYASKIGLTPQAWASADYNTKVWFLQKMQVEEWWKWQFVQQAWQEWIAQFDPIKWPQYEQYNSKGVVPKWVDPNTFKQEALEYKKDSIWKEATKYLDSIDKLLASDVTRNERLAINTAPSIASLKWSYADIINAYNNIISKLNLKSLTDAKAQWATFWQLTSQELKVLWDAATSLKLTSSDEEWKKQLAIIWNALLTASGQEPKYWVNNATATGDGASTQTQPTTPPAPAWNQWTTSSWITYKKVN